MQHAYRTRIAELDQEDFGGAAPGKRTLTQGLQAATPQAQLIGRLRSARSLLRRLRERDLPALGVHEGVAGDAMAMRDRAVEAELALAAVDRELDEARLLAAVLGNGAVDPLLAQLTQERTVIGEQVGAATPSIGANSADGDRLPATVRAEMEAAFSTDFSTVTVSEDGDDDARGALASTRGEHISFARGRYVPDTRAGKELLGHELMHVLQQRAGRGVTDDAALEREADDAGARAARGEVAARGASGTGPASGAVVQMKRNELISFDHPDVDARTGLHPDDVKLVTDFVANVNRHLAHWETQRGTPELRFTRGGELADLYRTFLRRRNDVGMLEEELDKDARQRKVWEAARHMLDTPRNRQLVQEIRIFSNDMLYDYRDLLGVEDIVDTHVYEMQPVSDQSVTAAFSGMKGGFVSRTLRMRYTNTHIKGLTWTQDIDIDGLVFGIQASARDLFRGAKGEAPGRSRGATMKGGTPSWIEPSSQPARYLAPSWFDGAAFNRGAAGVKAGIPYLEGEVSTSDMIISKQLDVALMKLMWQLPPSFAFAAKLPGDPPSKLDPDASLGATMETGEVSLDGKLDFQGGEWSKLAADDQEDHWQMLYAAAIYFPTGSADVDQADRVTVDGLLEKIRARAAKQGSERFKIRIRGCHSQAWKSIDDQMATLMTRFADGGLGQAGFDRAMARLTLRKEGENAGLAQLRAENVQLEMARGLLAIQHRLAVSVDPALRFVEPSTRDPMGEDPSEDLAVDRSVDVVVFYAL